MKTKMTKFLLLVIVLIFSTSIAYAGINENNTSVNEAAVESLIQDLADQNLSVKVNAVKTLVEMGEPAVKPLIQALKDNNPEIRENAAQALGKIGDERAVGPLIKVMNDPNEILPTRENAILALGEFGGPAVEPLIQAMEDESPQIRARAAEALGKIGDERAIIPLNKALDDNYGMVRDAARMGVRGFEGHDKYRAITTYGKERNFSTEDEREEWRNKLDEISSGARDEMLAYNYPYGPVVSYGYNDNGYISVDFSEGDGVSEAFMSQIYDIFNWQAMQRGIGDVPVVFKFINPSITGDATDVCGEFYDVPQNTPGFTAITLLMAFLGLLLKKTVG